MDDVQFAVSVEAVARIISGAPFPSKQSLAKARRVVCLLERKEVPSTQVSKTTQALIDLLVARDVAGLAKYGTTLDRTDLTRDQWLQHMAEELLDGAGYALAAKRTGAD